jgi:hypothetical protein
LHAFISMFYSLPLKTWFLSSPICLLSIREMPRNYLIPAMTQSLIERLLCRICCTRPLAPAHPSLGPEVSLPTIHDSTSDRTRVPIHLNFSLRKIQKLQPHTHIMYELCHFISCKKITTQSQVDNHETCALEGYLNQNYLNNIA